MEKAVHDALTTYDLTQNLHPILTEAILRSDERKQIKTEPKRRYKPFNSFSIRFHSGPPLITFSSSIPLAPLLLLLFCVSDGLSPLAFDLRR